MKEMKEMRRRCEGDEGDGEGDEEIRGRHQQETTEKPGRSENNDSLCARKEDHGLSFDAPWVVKQKMQMYRPKEPDVSFDAPWVVKHHGLM